MSDHFVLNFVRIRVFSTANDSGTLVPIRYRCTTSIARARDTYHDPRQRHSAVSERESWIYPWIPKLRGFGRSSCTGPEASVTRNDPKDMCRAIAQALSIDDLNVLIAPQDSMAATPGVIVA